ncbi:hypothetical protein GM418_11055 [Maribellus comscasis]|uniref:STAS/SEC14 domain-containing protein n=1 Tax=Maribellus comscasis TaxID=2681766 RepID=A0A6I6JSX2_9BACT|nr:hypothetical protein [Maribellus comscasis]QGY44178.1 hypothetical protein GM418_11055 [Maribellus comscasis]
MNAVFKYKIDHELKINYDIIQGEVDLNMVIQHEKTRIQSDKFNEDYNSLIDIRGANFINFMENVGKFCDFLNDYTKRINMERKCAIVTSTPLEVVNSTVFSLGLKQRGTSLKFESFSSEEAAIKWLIR